TTIKWGKAGTDYIVELTGIFTTMEKSGAHLRLVSKGLPADIPIFVTCVNHRSENNLTIVSSISFTTNCLAKLATVHASLLSNMDSPSWKIWCNGCGSPENIIPASTGAAKGMGKVIPEMNGKPTHWHSLLSLHCKCVRVFHILGPSRRWGSRQEGPLKDIGGYTEHQVTTYFSSDNHSSTFDAGAGIALDDHFFKVIAWCDNEFAYSNIVVDFMALRSSSP
uniref:glyceraldehyde-3-phosphate dehydrogenase (phosphorylating) n=1 Tax=Otolemur garnettii TaxID=30611 RepID=H0XMU2_OTOGA